MILLLIRNYNEKCQCIATDKMKPEGNPRDSRHSIRPQTKLQARAIANDCYKFILHMSTNAGIVSDALKYVGQKTETIQKLDER
jgi:hypothetical protein